MSLALPQPALALRPEVDRAGLEEALGRETSGLEEGSGVKLSRRKILQMAGRGLLGLLGSRLLTACAGLTPEQVAQPGPMGTFASLREKLQGDKRQLGLDVGDPEDLRRLPLVFPLAARAGFGAVWFSGSRFLQMTSKERQEIFTQASRAGIQTIGFTDGDRDQLSSFKAGLLRITFAPDSIHASISDGELQNRREEVRAVVPGEGPRESQIETWCRMAGHLFRRGVNFHIAVPAKGFAFMEEEIAPAIEAAYRGMLEEERASLLGFIVQTGSPLSAQRVLMESMPAQPAPQFGARVMRFSPTEITLELDLTQEMIDEPWVAIPFVKRYSSWLALYFDERNVYPIRVNGRVTVKAPITIPFIGGSTEGRAVVFLPRSQTDRAVQAYKERNPLAAMRLSFWVVVIGKDRQARVASLSEIIQELRNSGLEEWKRGDALLGFA